MNTSIHPATVLSDVFSILESKIQYIEYQAHCSMHRCVGKPDDCRKHQPSTRNLTQKFEQMLQHFREQTRELKRLQVIKYWLREDNLGKVLDLLHNNSYRQHSEESLEKLLKKGALELLKMKANNEIID